MVDAPVKSEVIKPLQDPKLGSASSGDIDYLVERIREAKLPVLLVGMRGSSKDETANLFVNLLKNRIACGRKLSQARCHFSSIRRPLLVE